MSLQHYRSQLAARQNRRLMLYLSLAVGLHAVGLGLAHSDQWLRPKTSQNPTPIEFVNIEPSQTKQTQPLESTSRRAQVDAEASRNLDSKRPPQTSQTSSQTNSAQTSLSPSLPSAVVAPSPQSAPPLLSTPLPLPSASPAPHSGAVPSVSVPSPLLAAPSAMPSSPSGQPSATPTPPNTAAPPNLPSAAQLGNPLTASASLEGQGLTGQLNSNRAGDGTSVDAVADEVWGDYLSLLNRAINQNWQRVSVADTRRTRLRFRVDRQGNLADLRLVQPSGDALADEAAIQAVRAAAPFAPLPQSASEQVLIVNFTFTQWKIAPEP